MEKKRHHFVAESYLTSFCNDDEKLCVYFKEKAGDFQFIRPDAIAFEKFYYSQPLPEGRRDNNSIEDFFSKIETKWRPLIQKIERGEVFSRDDEITLLEFALLHRVRVPAARDAAEKMLAERVKMESLHLLDTGAIPPPPKSLGNIQDVLQVAIDPHMSMHAMVGMAEGVATIFDAIGFEILENDTGEGFITSDNPVIYFDPTVSLSSMEPYNISRSQVEVEFMFPITPRFMLWGHSALRRTPGQYNSVPRRHLTDKGFVERANMLAARFAYRVVFSNVADHHPLIKRFAGRSPVASVAHMKTSRGRGVHIRSTFGKREVKPKWKGSSQA
jgi:Protein of unknown function (DUF4238)